MFHVKHCPRALLYLRSAGVRCAGFAPCAADLRKRIAPILRDGFDDMSCTSLGRRGMASDDALAQGQNRKRWFGGRGSSPQEHEGDMAPTESAATEEPAPSTTTAAKAAPTAEAI